MSSPSPNKLERVGEVLLDPLAPLKQRFRALFTLKNVGGPIAVESLLKCFDDENVLLKHEAAYCLGQMKAVSAIPKLIDVLKNTDENVVVRHEAAEALGAIGEQEVKPILEQFRNNDLQEIAETCEIALARLDWLANGGIDETNPYNSVDPAPALDETDLGMLRELYVDTELPISERYRAMFALRNINTISSVMTLAEGLEDPSALFRHEVAFVLGQIKATMAEIFLHTVLKDEGEHEMVRHECAEAIGVISSTDCTKILTPFLDHENTLIRDSCIVALDIAYHEKARQYQYANALEEAEAADRAVADRVAAEETEAKIAAAAEISSTTT